MSSIMRFEVALFGFKAEGLTQPLPVPKAPEHENTQVLGPKGRHITLMCRHLRG